MKYVITCNTFWKKVHNDKKNTSQMFFPCKRESVAMFELKIVVQVENGPVISATVLDKHIHNFCGYQQLSKVGGCYGYPVPSLSFTLISMVINVIID